MVNQIGQIFRGEAGTPRAPEMQGMMVSGNQGEIVAWDGVLILNGTMAANGRQVLIRTNHTHGVLHVLGRN